ncbi:DHA2 family efflux MFS transporter permease subunit [Pelosinus propionicus]|uniref:MFS transporter, DHA2 family, lincomycin resistance protein n=1 Tax=Pelosinus propionicus DSM 13327 TaxID=1123291 RepID=A0A1I4PNA7_9FIRM|nr:DHA2 family efflux MFS transporter permease subunit [Pelosinus propionicus]SFM29277.1 MFS transporter, DHA2 family, lincomycin resistance protein [Pelosinus propionicus DSM 13327]
MMNCKSKDIEIPAQAHLSDRNIMIAVVSIAIVTFIGILSETALNIAYALLMNEFGISASVIQWLTTGYLLALSILLPLSPLFVRHFRTKTLFQAAVTIFTFGTLLCAFTLNFEMLFLGRIVQAIGTSISFPLMMNIILEKIPVARRGKCMGIVGLVTSFAPALGPTFGGFVIEWINWHWIFISMLPILVVSFILGSKYIPDIHSKEKKSIDYLSVLLSTIAFVGIVYGVSISDLGWSSPAVLSYIIMGGLSLAAFAYRQLRLAKPLIQVRVFSNSMFTIGACIVMISMMTVLAAGFVLPLYIQKSLGYASIAAALAMLPGAIVNGIMSPVAGKFYDKHGPRLLLFIGFLLLSITLLLFSFVSITLFELTIIYTVFMFGASMLAMPAQTNSLNQLPRQYYADGAAIMGTLQQVAGAVGTALASSLLTINSVKYSQSFSSVTADGIAQSIAFGTQQNFIVFLILSVIGLILTLFVRKNTISA